MKTFFELLLCGLIVLFIVSCQKDEQPPKEPQFKIDMLDDANETRSGGHQFVFFSQSMTVLHTLTNLYPQLAFNRGLTDSIVLIKSVPEVDAFINPGTTAGRYCFLYTVIIYHRDIFPSQIIAYAPATFGDRATFIPTGQGWSTNIIFAELQRNQSVYQEYFDLACQNNRRNYAYRINTVTQDTSYTANPILAGNNGCGDLYKLKASW